MKKLCTKLVSPQINDVKWKYLVLNKSGAGLDITQAFPMEQYGKTIKVYYNEEWYNKYLYFFPYYKSVDINLYSLWHIEQPLSLNFNGERLEILSNQVKEGSFQHYIKENYQSCILPAKEPEQEKVIDIFPKTDKMAEGEYYILLDEIENSIIPVYKPIPVCYNTHYGFTFSKTENTISKYQLLGGCKSIYLFNEYQEFVLKLKEIIKNKYNNKLYTYQGKTPIKLEVDYRRFYIDEDGYIQGANIKEPILDGINIKSKLIAKIGNGILDVINAVILHRTVSYTTKSVFDTWLSKSNSYRVGAHFVIDKDGIIYQCLSIYKKAHHVGKIRSRALEMQHYKDDTDRKLISEKKNNYSTLASYEYKKQYPLRFPCNSDSIGIEVVSMYIRETKEWEKATEAQIKSINLLLDILLKYYTKNDGSSLTVKDIYPHDKIAYKTDGEGGGLYDYKY